MKRALDIFLSVLFLVILFPLMLILAAVTLWKMGFPILCKSKKHGLHGKVFALYKFRAAADKQFAAHEFMRFRRNELLWRYKLDKLPILINILKGDMSFVGPQLLEIEELALFSREQVRRYHVKPGIIGLVSIQCNAPLTWTEQIELDVWYVDHRCFRLDMKIIGLALQKRIGYHQKSKNFGMARYGQISGLHWKEW